MLKNSLHFLSIFLMPILAQSQCVESFPYSENFDAATWNVPVSLGQPGTIAPCWTRNPQTGGYLWVAGPIQPLPYSFTGPAVDHTSGNGKFAYAVVQTSGSTTSDLLTPFIDLSSANNPEISFWYHMYGLEISNLTLQASNGGAWTTINTITGQQQNYQGAPWAKATASLAAFVGDTVRLRFRATKTGNFALFAAQIAMDDIVVQEGPTCARPTNFSATATTASSTLLSFTPGNASNLGWEIAYGVQGFNPASGTIVSATTNPFILTGLSGSFTYDIYVREICSATDKSPWVGPITISTPCSAPLTAPFFESFDGMAWEPYISFSNLGSLGSCWVKNPNASGNYTWLVNPNGLLTPATGPLTDHTTGSGKYMACQQVNGNSSTSGILRSPQIDLSGVSNPELSFWYHMFGSQIDELEVQVQQGTSPWVTISTISGQQQTSSTAPWLEQKISLNAYANQTIFIRFVAKSTVPNATIAKIAIDDVSITAGSSCPIPSGLSVSSITSNQAQANWNTLGGGTFQVKYGLTGFNPSSTGTAIFTATPPATLSSLLSGTSYDFYVRRICSNDTSAWSSVFTFKTQCLVSAPYQENFDNAGWVAATSGTSASLGSIDSCWERNANFPFFWGAGPSANTSLSTGPGLADHTSGTGKYISTQRLTAAFGSQTAEIFSPLIDLSPLDTPELSFWYHKFGNQMGDLIVAVNDGNGWNNLLTIAGQQQNNQSAAWEEAIVDLSAYDNDTVQLRFTGTRAGNFFNSEMAVDDIDIHELPTCAKPNGLTASNVTFNSVNLNWTSGGATNWVLKYKEASAPPTQTNIVSVSANPFTLSGLNAATTYQIWVRDSCGLGDVSLWTGPVIITTGCAPVSFPYSENFDGSTFLTTATNNPQGAINSCYQRSDVIEYFWVPASGNSGSQFSGPNADHTSGSGKYMFALSTNFFSARFTNFSTPWVDLSSTSTPELTFWYHMYGGRIDKLEVYVKKIDGTQQLIRTITGQQQSTSSAAWLQSINNLTAFAGDTIAIEFKAYTLGGNIQAEIAIDDLAINQATSCPNPTGLSATTISNTSVELSWNSSFANSIIEYGPAGFTPGNGTAISAGTSNPFVVTGLAQGTCYDFYVRDSCGLNLLSAWTGPVNACTLNCLNSCTYQLKLTDTFGDGWTTNVNGVFHTLDVSIGPSTKSYTFKSGNDTTIQLNVCNNDTIVLFFNDNGAWNNECGVELRNSSGVLVHNSSGYNSSLLIYTSLGVCTTPCPLPLAVYSRSNTGLTWSFDATSSSGNGISYNWDFGDGTVATGTTVQHTYSQFGNYVVTLVVTDSCGQTDSFVQSISICAPLLPSFTFSINNLSVSLDATATTGSNLQYGWLFGDGNNGTGSTTSHTYLADGTYTASLIVADSCGNVDTISQNITVCNAVNPQIGTSINNLTVDFLVVGATGSSNYSWDFGDGNVGSGSNTTHTYTAVGTYNVTVVYTNLCGNQVTASQTIELCTPAAADWKYVILSSGATGMNIQFDGSASTGASSFLWEFGDGATNSTSLTPVHTYASAGLFWVVKLTVTNACGDSDVLQSSLASIGIEDFEQIGIKAFPNPADDALLLKVPEFIAVKDITLHNAAGALVWQQLDGFESLTTIPTSAFANGNYILKLNTVAGTATYQIVVRH